MFREDKATAMACLLLDYAPNRTLNQIKLMKLMYIAERKSLEKYAAPITDDKYVSMPHGPVLSNTCNLLRNQKLGKVWNRYISPLENNFVRLQVLPDIGEILRKSEIAILEEVWAMFGSWRPWKLRNYCHRNFDEYDKAAEEQDTSFPIELETIFTALGDDEEVAHAKAAEIAFHASL